MHEGNKQGIQEIALWKIKESDLDAKWDWKNKS